MQSRMGLSAHSGTQDCHSLGIPWRAYIKASFSTEGGIRRASRSNRRM
jgi:hypothetical protein